MAWGEAGTAIRYVEREDVGRMVPDYRGGVAYGRLWGRGIASESAGAFFETNLDGIYISRFSHDILGYAQTRTGWTLPPGPARVQLYLNANATVDNKRQAWANFAELGPGVRVRIAALPPGLYFTFNYVRGRYTIREGNPYAPVYNDFRSGLWYAITR
jgi:hypothetical protein